MNGKQALECGCLIEIKWVEKSFILNGEKFTSNPLVRGRGIDFDARNYHKYHCPKVKNAAQVD